MRSINLVVGELLRDGVITQKDDSTFDRETVIEEVRKSYQKIEGYSLNPFLLAQDVNKVLDKLEAYDKAMMYAARKALHDEQ